MKEISKILFVLVIILMTNCSKEDDPSLEYTNLKTIEIKDYKFEFPSQFQLIEEQGIDSYYGRIVGSGIELIFDYGPYTEPYQNLSNERFEIIFETFDSVERQIVIGKNPKEDFTGIHIRDLNNSVDSEHYISLQMFTNEISQEQQNLVVQIFKSAVLIE